VKKRVTIYWLVPAKPERELFRDVVRILAEQFDAPGFEPHLTLGKAGAGQSPAKLLRQIRIPPLRLGVSSISHSSKFTETLVIRFRPDDALERIGKSLGVGSKSLRNPHLSLLYKRLPTATRREVAAAIALPFREVVFDAVKAVRCITPTETRADVESWHVIATKRLAR
jgi:hypothetical protein